MGKKLYDNFSVAKDVYLEVDDTINFKLSKLIFEGAEEDLARTENTQPALMATSIATLRVLEEISGKKFESLCSVTAGHSLGQYSAMCAGGSLSLKDTAFILKNRGKFMQESGGNKIGAMAAIIGASNDIIAEVLEGASKIGICQIANDNSDSQKVISGEAIAIDYAIEKFKEHGAKGIKLKVSNAFHSNLMNEAAERMKEIFEDVTFKNSNVDIIDNVTLTTTKDGEFLKNSLILQIPGTVRWRETTDILAKTTDIALEIGAGKVLTNLFKKSYPDYKSFTVSTVEEIEEVALL
jgi:[acyl-carrier-protein] S-malonyltransferase